MYKKHRAVVANKAILRSPVLSPRKINKSINVGNNHHLPKKNAGNKIFSVTMAAFENVTNVSLLTRLANSKLLVFLAAFHESLLFQFFGLAYQVGNFQCRCISRHQKD